MLGVNQASLYCVSLFCENSMLAIIEYLSCPKIELKFRTYQYDLKLEELLLGLESQLQIT